MAVFVFRGKLWTKEILQEKYTVDFLAVGTILHTGQFGNQEFQPLLMYYERENPPVGCLIKRKVL